MKNTCIYIIRIKVDTMSTGVALNCYECMSIDIMQKDITMLSNVAPLYDTVVEVAYNNTPPPQCDNAALVTCPEGQRCLTTKVILWGSCE